MVRPQVRGLRRMGCRSSPALPARPCLAFRPSVTNGVATGDAQAFTRTLGSVRRPQCGCPLQLAPHRQLCTVWHPLSPVRRRIFGTSPWVKNSNVWVKSPNLPALQAYDFVYETSFIPRAMWLHPAFQPAGALPLPDAEGRRGFFPRRRIQHADMPAAARQADAEVGVLGDVVGIPAADGIEHGARKMRT